ncbi:MAG: M48 family metalloprotease [Gammaproteobacteria bacterium]|nr:M48 family metalloprotease [Gammaproteobacteria bacterium]
MGNFAAEQPYPTGPASVPDNLTAPTSAYRRHAWLAMGGLALFSALYMLLTGWFIWTAYRFISGALEGGDSALFGILASLPTAFLAIFMLKALFFVKRGSGGDDIEVTPEQEPKLFAFLHRLADEVGAPYPHRVFLSLRVNAAVFYDLTILNLIFPSKKNLEIGLGLVNTISLGELKAVLAHEFGHFSQRTMAIGRWTHFAQQIAYHIIAERGMLDRFLGYLSRIDLRVAWIGWLLTLMVWSLRSILETCFNLVVLAERALSREMEFQADLVAVSVTGSDALIHALHRLHAADDSWDRALGFTSAQLQNGHTVGDIFAVQTYITKKLGTIFNDPHYGQTLTLPEDQPEAHRVFETEFAQPPQMWSTHPANSQREGNAKQTYVAAPQDDRSAWDLFGNTQQIKEKMSSHLVSSADTTKVTPLTLEGSLQKLDKQFGCAFLHSFYRGAYLWRSVVRDVEDADKLFEPATEQADIGTKLASLYPDSLADDLQLLRDLEKEKASLEALRDGHLTAPGGIIRHRGKELKRHELPRVIKVLQQECHAATKVVHVHDHRCRSSHLAAAASLEGGWHEHLVGLVKVLHYADHSEADLRDAQGLLANVVNVVTADGNVSSRELKRLLKAAEEVYRVLALIHEQGEQVLLDTTLRQRLEVKSWSEALGEFDFPPPDKENITDWMGAADNWVESTAGLLSALRESALEQLLLSEAAVARQFNLGKTTGAAPAPAKIPTEYATLTPGTERALQTRLGLWDRFQTADGFFPATVRLVVASAIVGAGLVLGGNVGNSSIVIYNGLDQQVQVDINGMTGSAPAYSSIRLEPPLTDIYTVAASAPNGKLIESFETENRGNFLTYVYNIAGASPIVEWTVTYGNAEGQPDRMLGAPRWMSTGADVFFEEPPESVNTKGEGTSKDVLTALGDDTPNRVLNRLESEEEQLTLITAHARWDNTQSKHVFKWLQFATQLADFPAILAGRLDDNPEEVLSLRMEQNNATEETYAKVCSRHAALAAASANNPDLQYLAARCIESGPERSQAYLKGHTQWPESGWWAFAAGSILASHAQWPEALSAWELARRNQPAIATTLAEDIARLRRVTAEDIPAELADLLDDSSYLRYLWALESGEGMEDKALRAFSELGKGNLQQALEIENEDADTKANLLRMAAASNGATPEMIDRALALPPDQGIDGDSIWPAVALAAKHGKELGPYIDLINESEIDHARDIFEFLRLVSAGDTLDGAEDLLNRLPPKERGVAYSVGLIIMGQDAPAHWRDMVKRLLFASERPYFG